MSHVKGWNVYPDVDSCFLTVSTFCATQPVVADPPHININLKGNRHFSLLTLVPDHELPWADGGLAIMHSPIEVKGHLWPIVLLLSVPPPPEQGEEIPPASHLELSLACLFIQAC